jgi:UDP-2-acetamido-3-amino-2,3-dideoxy-glucuronate N-acetyltransferase
MNTGEAIGQEIFIHPRALVESSSIGLGTRIWAFAHVMKGARVGSRCNIGDHAFVESGAVLGDGVTVKNGVAIWDRVTIEDGVFLGPHCVLTNDLTPRTQLRKSGDELMPTKIGANATVGANATILCGVTVGQGAFIGAGAVVVRPVPAFALMVGNPARQTGWMCACGQKLRLRPLAQEGTFVTCTKCSRELKVSAEGLTPVESASTIPEEAQ